MRGRDPRILRATRVTRDSLDRGPDLAGAGLIVLAAACFATLGPLGSFAADAGVDSLTLVTWRAAIGAVVVAAYIGFQLAVLGIRPARLRSLPRRDRWFMLAAAVANTILNLAAFIAFERIGIALTLLVFYLYPAGVAVVSTIWFGERLDRLRWSALGLSLVGMALVVAGAGTLGELDLGGIGLALLAAFAQVFYVLAARHGFAHVPAPQAAALTMGGAAVLYVAIAIVIGTLGNLEPAARLERGTRAGRARRRHRRRRADPRVRHWHPPARAVEGRNPGHPGAGHRHGAGGMAARRAAGTRPAALAARSSWSRPWCCSSVRAAAAEWPSTRLSGATRTEGQAGLPRPRDPVMKAACTACAAEAAEAIGTSAQTTRIPPSSKAPSP